MILLLLLLLFRASAMPPNGGNVGKVGLDDVLRRYFLLSTEYTHALFNSEVLEQHAGLARAGRN